MATSTALTRAREHIGELCRTAEDELTFRMAILDELRRVIGFDAHVWLMTDPSTCVGSAPLADVPVLQELPEAIRLKYLTGINRWTQLIVDGRVAASLGSRRDESRMWREVLSRYEIGDVASSVYADKYGCWGFLDLWRAEAAGPFGEADIKFLASVAEPVTKALRSCVAAKFLAPAVAHPRGQGPVVLVLDDHHGVVSQTAASQEWLDTLLPAQPGRSVVPASAYNVAGQLAALEEGIDDHPATTRVHLAEGLWLTVRAARLGASNIAVTLEEASPTERLDLYARACGLSARESELLGNLASGGDTREVAAQMSVSENTVQDHLKSIFDKTGARNRTTLLGRALGVR
ncbi:MAG: helix-turn-helix transcriptional regulator [Aeromicrobium sp.]